MMLPHLHRGAFLVLAAASVVTASDLVVKRTQPVRLPSCVDFTPFVYAGCFTDDKGPRTLLYSSNLDFNTMTVESCVAFCKGNGYKYAGLEYYGECFCGASVNAMQIEESKCNLPCNGNKTQSCGGNKAIAIYQDPTFPVVDKTTIADYMAMGCYSEGPNGRTLAWKQGQVTGDSLTVQKCLFACKAGGYAFAGLEYGRECFCGVVLGNGTLPLDPSRCDFPCAGDSSQLCGGRLTLNLYVARTLESTEPCGYVPVSSSSSSIPSTSTLASLSSSLILSSTLSSTSTSSSSSLILSSTLSSASSASSASSSSTPSLSGSSSFSTSSSISPSVIATPFTTSQLSTTPHSTSQVQSSTSTSSISSLSSTSTSISASVIATSFTTSQLSTPSLSTSQVQSSTSTFSISGLSSTSTSISPTAFPTPFTTTSLVSSSLTSISLSITSTTTISLSSITSRTTNSGTSSTLTIVSSSLTTGKTTSQASITTTTKPPSFCTSLYTVYPPPPTPTCEYKVGKWCAKPIPDFSDTFTCLKSFAACVSQLSACFGGAGYPDLLNCNKFNEYCSRIADFCDDFCPGPKCSVKGCRQVVPPYGVPSIPTYVEGTIYTTSYTCTLPEPSSTPPSISPILTSLKPSGTTSTRQVPSTTTPSIPTSSNICIQPNNPPNGYTPDYPIGGIPLPNLSCNNELIDYNAGRHFKLYTSPDSSKCPSYERSGEYGPTRGCLDACDEQYKLCLQGYADPYKIAKWLKRQSSEDYYSASKRCASQRDDCYSANRGINVGSKCGVFNSEY